MTFDLITVDLTNDNLVRQIHAVQLAAYAIESKLIDYPQLPPLFETLDDIRSANETFLACLLDEVVVGATSFVNSDNVIEICRLVIAPSHFRRGIGGRLLATIEALNQDWQWIDVSTAAKNLPAIALYEKNSYRIVRRNRLPDGLLLVHLQKHSLKSRK